MDPAGDRADDGLRPATGRADADRAPADALLRGAARVTTSHTRDVPLEDWPAPAELAAEHQGHGFATEGARAALGFGFGPLGLAEVVSFTARRNVRSFRVMERLGLVPEPAPDFDHPLVPVGHPVRPHVLHRITRARWEGLAVDPGPPRS